MVSSHIPVVEALKAILQRQNVTPANTLLRDAYDAMLFTAQSGSRRRIRPNYVNGQVEYQKGNAALFREEIQNGNDPALRQLPAGPCRRSRTICSAP
jgi:putative membrane protein